jgi:hypothetical protein
MRKFFISIFAPLLLLCACNQNKVSSSSVAEKDVFLPGILELQLYLSESENNVSFPVWFNDSVVRAERVKTIIRSIYAVGSGDTSDRVNELEELREIRYYYFNRDGQIDSFHVNFYFDDQLIDGRSFVYAGVRDRYGHRSLKESAKNEKGEAKDYLQAFRIHVPWKYQANAARYKDIVSGQLVAFIREPKFWGPFSVDTILKPLPDEQIVLGSARHPGKRYFVQNKVHESNVHEFQYSRRTQRIDTIRRKEYPFEIVRTMLYGDEGRCTGFVDSTFTDGIYLTRVLTNFHWKNKTLPKGIVRRKSAPEGKQVTILKEKFDYQFYE